MILTSPFKRGSLMLDGMNIMFAGDSAFEHSKKIASLFI